MITNYLIVGAVIGLVFAVAGLTVAFIAAYLDTWNKEEQ